MEDIKGRFQWYDLMTGDMEAAKAFYTELMGWKTQLWETGDGPAYQMLCVGDRPIGGLMDLPDEARAAGAPPHWIGYVGTNDADATVKQVTQAGGKVLVPPTDIPKVGRFAIFQDPQGATLATIATEDGKPMDGPDQVGDVAWRELATTDYKAAWGFYQALYGWQNTQDMDMGPQGTYRIFMAGPHGGGGVFNKPADMAAPPHWLYYFRVAELEAALERCQRLGGKVLNGPMEVPGGDRVAQCADPQGAVFALHCKGEQQG